MRDSDQPLPTESPLLFEIDPEPLPGASLQSKQRQRGYDEPTFVESFVILNAVGGECRKDFERLREDAGLSELTGHGVPSPEAAQKFLYQFHDDAKIEEARRRRAPEEIAYLPEETEALLGLGMVNRELVAGRE